MSNDNKPRSGKLRSAVWWFIGLVLGFFLHPVLMPTIGGFLEPIGIRIADLVHGTPPNVWKTDRVGGCVAGDIGRRAEVARRDGVLRQIGQYTDQVWVCGDHAFDEPLLIERFGAIADRYPSCFGFNNEGRRLGISLGWIGVTNRRFWVDPASPAVCSTGLVFREGDRRFIQTDHLEGRLICMGDAEFKYVVQGDKPLNSVHPRSCSDSEMQRYDFDKLLPKDR
jgi:hypothetical protein